MPSSPPVLTDPELAEALIAGRPDAASIAWARFAPVVRRTLARRLGHMDLDDLVQEVFCSLFQAVPKLQNPYALRRFVLVIAVRRVRAERRRRTSDVGSAISTKPDLTDAVVSATNVQAQYSVLRLFHLLAGLREKDRRAFVLRVLEGKSTRETARCTDVSIATARRRIRRAEARLHSLAAHDLFLSEYSTGSRSQTFADADDADAESDTL